MIGEQTAIVVKNQLSELERVSHVVESFGRRHRLATKLIFDVKLALDEILTNVIAYAYPDGGEHDIVVRFSVAAGELAVEVEDDGQAFNPLDTKLPDMNTPLEERPIGGLGMHLVHQVMDKLEYHREEGKNVLVMKRAVR